MDLDGKWEVKKEGADEATPAIVPGCVHTDLMAAKKIPDPFWRDNEKDVQWVSEANWIYSRSFDVANSLLANQRVLLRCEGLDTLATLELNGARIGKTDNMFRTYEFDVKRLLHAGKNTLLVKFDSVLPLVQGKEKERKLPTWAYPGAAYIRKEPCNFGWDWGPTLITCGIWRPIGLVAFDTARLTDVAIHQDHAQKGKVKLTVDVTAEAVADKPLLANVKVLFDKKQIATTSAPLKQGKGQAELAIENPQLWWPAGMGEQPLYRVEVDLQGGESTVDHTSRRIGLRVLRTIQQTEKEPLHFEANGIPFFAKGANWIPTDSFATRVTPEILRRYMDDAVASNMNCLRFWGGGYYEEDALYDLCDERGLCIWLDFKFGCTTYPAFDKAFLENVKAEARDNIIRLRHHPSIALWCGNNEIMFFRGGDNWTADKMSAADYYTLFRDTLGGVLHELAPQADYVTGSPDCGDVHFWEVWHGGKPFEVYRNIHGYMSEFGFQSFPEPKTVQTFTEKSDRDTVYSHVMKYHERSNRMYLDVKEDGKIGTDKIMILVRKYFREPKDFDSTLWLSQVTQGYGIKYGAEGWRREMPRSMGCVYWQYNDTWPGSSWASVDYFGRWKALQYMARHFYAPVLVSGAEDAKAGKVDAWITSDLLGPAKGTLRWTVTDLAGKALKTGGRAVDIAARTSGMVQSIPLANEIKRLSAKGLLVWLALEIDGRTVSQNLVTLVYPRELELLDPEIKTDVIERQGGYAVLLWASHPALWTWLELDGIDARYSDNFFHVAPGRPVEILVHPARPISKAEIQKALRVRSLYDTYSHK